MAKRLFDVVVGTLMALLCIPLIAVLSVGVCLSLRTCQPFFAQRRLGHRGRPFWMVKLRTLPKDVHPYRLKTKEKELVLPRFVSFLRRRHLDELPQLFLVPFGRLSLVGPRPKMPDMVEPVDHMYGKMRVQVPQGCTGLWQIGAHAHDLPDATPEYDFFYLEHATFRFDVWILWRTVLLMIGAGRSFELASLPKWTYSDRAAWLVPTLGGDRDGSAGLATTQVES